MTRFEHWGLSPQTSRLPASKVDQNLVATQVDHSFCQLRSHVDKRWVWSKSIKGAAR